MKSSRFPGTLATDNSAVSRNKKSQNNARETFQSKGEPWQDLKEK
jgi:hypothetical protein